MNFLISAMEAFTAIVNRIRGASKAETEAKHEANKAEAEAEITAAEERERAKRGEK